MNRYVFTPYDGRLRNGSEHLATWMVNAARNGIFDVFHIPFNLRKVENGEIDFAREQLEEFVKEISQCSRYLSQRQSQEQEKSGDNDFRIVDTALKDSKFVFTSMLKKAQKQAKQGYPVNLRVLLANPGSEFALARNRALGTNAIGRLTDGLKHICDTLTAQGLCQPYDLIVGRDYQDVEKISRLMKLINSSCTETENITCQVKLYSGPLYGPLYFFQNILLQGKFSSAQYGSANLMPWLVLVNNPSASNDMYDTWSYEFDIIWNNALLTLEPDYVPAVQTDIYIVYCVEYDEGFENSFNSSITKSFVEAPTTHYVSTSSSNRFTSMKSLNSSMKFSKIVIFVPPPQRIEGSNSNYIPFEVAAGILNNQYIATLQNGNENLPTLLQFCNSGIYSPNNRVSLESLFRKIGESTNKRLKATLSTSDIEEHFS